MKKLSGFCLLFAVATAALLSLADPAAAFERYIRVTNTSTAPGICSITIESFGLLAPSGAHPQSITSFNINVSIPNGSTSSNSATLIRNDVDTALPGDYVVTVPVGYPNIVKILRTTGTFTMSITNHVAGQTIEEASIYLPALDEAGLLLLSITLLAAGVVLLRRRARATA